MLPDCPHDQPELPAQPQLGRYQLIRVLGRGTHGVVFAGHDTHLSRPVAIKVFADGSTLADARREATLAAAVDHPNVITIHDIGEAEGLVYLTMELVIGGTVHDYLQTWHEWRDIVMVFLQAAHGLAAVHEAGVVHGDIKPNNLLMTQSGRVLIGDFGLARTHFDPHERGGTPGYLAPERLAGGPADPATDQFAFCVSLWSALYRSLPWDTNTADIMHTTTPRRARPRLDVPASLVRVLMRGLAVDPRRRFAHMGALVEALNRVLLEHQRRRARWWVVGVGVLGMLAAAWWT